MITISKIKSKIINILKISKIINAIKLISSTKLISYKNKLNNNIAYTNSINKIINKLACYELILKNKFIFKKNENILRCYIVVGTDLGFCGNYNNDLFKYTSLISKKNDEIIILGLKSFKFFKKNTQFKINKNFINFKKNINEKKIDEFSTFLLESKYDEINIIYTKFIDSTTYKIVNFKLFPLINEIDDNDKNLLIPIIEPNIFFLLNKIKIIYIKNNIIQIIINSQICEQINRIYTTEKTIKNINKTLNLLKIKYNKIRQFNITEELAEINN